jgi:hypothetical protein
MMLSGASYHKDRPVCAGAKSMAGWECHRGRSRHSRGEGSPEKSLLRVEARKCLRPESLTWRDRRPSALSIALMPAIDLPGRQVVGKRAG